MGKTSQLTAEALSNWDFKRGNHEHFLEICPSDTNRNGKLREKVTSSQEAFDVVPQGHDNMFTSALDLHFLHS